MYLLNLLQVIISVRHILLFAKLLRSLLHLMRLVSGERVRVYADYTHCSVAAIEPNM